MKLLNLFPDINLDLMTPRFQTSEKDVYELLALLFAGVCAPSFLFCRDGTPALVPRGPLNVDGRVALAL